jgi:hypothetical protein
MDWLNWWIIAAVSLVTLDVAVRPLIAVELNIS